MKKPNPVALQALAALTFSLVLLGSLALATIATLWLAIMGAGLGHGGLGREDFTFLGLVFSAVVGLGLAVATVMAYAIRRADAIGARLVTLFRAARQRIVPEAEARELRCDLCGTMYPSVYYFTDARAERLVCSQCARVRTR